jgi:uncharacterized phiE125 gp8 family phage protein
MPSEKIVSTTGSEIVSVSVAKAYMRIDTSDDDSLIATMIEQARIWSENYIGRDIVAKSRKYYLEYVNDRFSIPFYPINEITSVTSDGSSADYDTYGLHGEIIALNQLPSKDIIIEYTTTGFDNGLLQQAILQLVSTYYDNRADFIVLQGVSFVKVPTEVTQILNSFKNMFI